MKTTTAQTLAALRAIAGLDFHPLGRGDRALYADADADAQIAVGDASLLVDLTSAALDTGPASLEVVISGDRVEFFAAQPDGGIAGFALNLSREA